MLKVLDLPYGKFRDKGQPIDNVSNYDSSQETCIFLAPLCTILEQKLLFGTASGMVKLVSGREFDVSKRTTAATKLADADELIFVQALAQENGAKPLPEQQPMEREIETGIKTLVMQSQKGMFLRIEAASIPEKKKTAIGVRGIRLAEDDRLTHMYLLGQEDGLVKADYEPSEVVLNRLRIGARDTKGVKR